MPEAQDTESIILGMRHAQRLWSEISASRRAAMIAKVANEIAKSWESLAESAALPHRTDTRETVVTELLPLAEACRFLGRRAGRILAPKALKRGLLPMWMGRLKAIQYREPKGVVLILGTWNYPLLLPGVQIFQALAAGNAVLFKPAEGAEKAALELVRLATEVGIPKGLLEVLSSDPASGRQAIESGVDHIILTGSAATGRKILQQAAVMGTPATMELSGCDAVYVMPGCDIARAASAIYFGLTLNGGATCIAPRRILALDPTEPPLLELLAKHLADADFVPVRPAILQSVKAAVEEAVADGAKLLAAASPESTASQALPASTIVNNVDSSPLATPWYNAAGDRMRPIIVTNVKPHHLLARSDLFAPVASIIPVRDTAEALSVDRQCPYALAATIFGPVVQANHLATSVQAGCICINDMIAPTADPRLPFGGRAASGFGVTRGEEGLLEVTQIKIVTQRIGNWLPHLDRPQPSDKDLLSGLLEFWHGGAWNVRIQGMKRMFQAVRNRGKKVV